MRRHIYYTLQSLLHKQGSNAIKIVSLALGLLMSVFLFARIAFELSFDNFYHDSDNLYIVKNFLIRYKELRSVVHCLVTNISWATVRWN